MTNRIEIPLNDTTERTGHGRSSGSTQHDDPRHVRNNASNRPTTGHRCGATTSGSCGRAARDAPGESGSFPRDACKSDTFGRGFSRRRRIASARLASIRSAIRASRLISRCLLVGLLNRAIGGAQVSPIDVRAQGFAADGAAGGALDFDAALGGHLLYAISPLTQHDRTHAQMPGQFGRRAPALKVGFEVHGISLASRFRLCQAQR